MKIIYVDDEKAALINYQYDNKERTDIKEQAYFQKPYEAIAYVSEHEVDAAFLDITMPEMDGIELGKELKKINPLIEIIYVTGYDNYALEAYKVGGRAYLSKPYTEEELDNAYALLKRLISTHNTEETQTKQVDESKKIHMRTFRNFDMVVDGTIIAFTNAKAKELLALLVDHRGGSVTSAQIFYKLWEGKEYNSTTSTYVRRTIRALRQQLEECGVSEILVTSRAMQSVDTSKFTCDYYEVLDGSQEYAKAYKGYYMTQYSWSEETNALISMFLHYE